MLQRRGAPSAARRALTATEFEGSAATIAPWLLGKLLLVADERTEIGGVIVETEAYLGAEDPASHIARGRTPRTEPFFRGAGTIYAYAIHQQVCVNLITWLDGRPECVLIRALEPTLGIDAMRARRGRDELRELTSGPGKLCRALGITCADSGRRLGDGRFAVIDFGPPTEPISVSARIGIRKAADWPMRFFLSGNPHVSRTRA